MTLSLSLSLSGIPALLITGIQWFIGVTTLIVTVILTIGTLIRSTVITVRNINTRFTRITNWAFPTS